MAACSMDEAFSRSVMLYGKEGMEKLEKAHVAVFGLGGVWGYVTESLARAGVGALTLVDHDTVSVSNLNRQIFATIQTLGRLKTEAAGERIRLINPSCSIVLRSCFFLPETADSFCFSDYDYVVDAVDTITAKLCIIQSARTAGVPVISAMGTGNKKDPSLLRISDLYETAVDPLARVMRRECRRRGVESLKVVWSSEEPTEPIASDGLPMKTDSGKPIPGSSPFVPAVAGLLLAAEVVNHILRV